MFVKHFAKVFLEIPRAPGAIFFHAKAWTQMRVKTHGKSAHPGFARESQKKNTPLRREAHLFYFRLLRERVNRFVRCVTFWASPED